MNSELIIPMIVRWIHVVSAILAIGAPFFVRFALLPAASQELDDATHQRLRAAVNARWSKVVYLLITLFILTGLYNFLVETRVNGVLVTARWKDFNSADKRMYHMLFGIKVLGAFAIFFLASALAGRSAVFAPVRKNARKFLTALLLLALVVLVCSTMLRYLPWESVLRLPLKA